MSRLPNLRKEELDERRLAVWQIVHRTTGSERVNEGGGLIGPFNAFVHNLTQEARIRCLQRCCEHLLPGGLLAFDTFFPGLHSAALLEALPAESLPPAWGMFRVTAEA